MDNNLISQAQSQFIYNNYAACAKTCDEILAVDACNFDALHYKAISLLMVSTMDNFHVPEAIKAAEVCKNVAINKTEICDEFLTKFNTEMDRMGQELLQRIRDSNNRERNTTCLSQTHTLMKCYEVAFASLPEAGNRMKTETLKMCNKWISGLTGWAHDAAKIYNSNRPYNESLKRMLAGGAAFDVSTVQPTPGRKQSEFGVAGFVCSFFPFLCYLGVVLSIVGIVTQWKTRRKSLAIAGIVIGIVMSMITMVIIEAMGYM